MATKELPAWTKQLNKGDKVWMQRGGYGRNRAFVEVEVTRTTKTSVFVNVPHTQTGSTSERRFVPTGYRDFDYLIEYGNRSDRFSTMRQEATLYPLDSERVAAAKTSAELNAAQAQVAILFDKLATDMRQWPDSHSIERIEAIRDAVAQAEKYLALVAEKVQAK